MSSDGWKVYIPLPGTIGIIALITVVLLTIAFFAFPSYREEIKFFSTMLGVAAAITSAIYIGRSIGIQTKANRIRSTFSYMETWNSPNFFHAKKSWRTLMRRVVADTNPDRVIAMRNALSAEGENHERNEANLLEVLNFLEGLALAVNHKYVDEEIAGNFFKTIVGRTYECAADWIKERRREVGPRVYREMEKLYIRWFG